VLVQLLIESPTVKVLEAPNDDGSTKESVRLLVTEELSGLVVLTDDTDLNDLCEWCFLDD